MITDSGWTFAAAPYLWMAGIEGDIAQFGLPRKKPTHGPSKRYSLDFKREK